MPGGRRREEEGGGGRRREEEGGRREEGVGGGRREEGGGVNTRGRECVSSLAREIPISSHKADECILVNVSYTTVF